MTSIAAEAPRRPLATFVPDLPRPVWALQAGMLVNSLGTGVLMPFLIIYLHDVRGFPLATAGLVAATFGGASMVATPFAGALIDRFGGRAVLIAAPLLAAAGYALFVLVRSPWQAFVCMAFAGVGNGLFWPSNSVVMLRLVPAERRHVAFSVNRMTANLGMGLGVVAGGLVVASGGAGRFELLFLANALSFVALAAVVILLVAPAKPDEPIEKRRAERGSYRSVLRDRTFVTFIVVNTVFVAVGYAQLEAGVPVFARHQVHLSTSTIGFVFLANLAAVVLFQLPASRLVEGRRRMPMLAVTGAVWAISLLVVAGAGLAGSTPVAVGMLVAAALVFGLAECLHASISAPLCADLAPSKLRGRYMAMSTNSYAIGFTVGPAVAGLILGLAPFALWPLAAVGCLGAGALALGLERRLPAAVRLTPVS